MYSGHVQVYVSVSSPSAHTSSPDIPRIQLLELLVCFRSPPTNCLPEQPLTRLFPFALSFSILQLIRRLTIHSNVFPTTTNVHNDATPYEPHHAGF